MTISPTTHARQTVLAALKAESAVTARIPAARIYPSKTPNTPVKPFARYGASDDTPERYSGWRGGDVSSALHVFVAQSEAIPDPEAWCGDTVGAIADAIDALPDCIVERTQVIPDAEEPDVMHGIVFFTMKALAPV